MISQQLCIVSYISLFLFQETNNGLLDVIKCNCRNKKYGNYSISNFHINETLSKLRHIFHARRTKYNPYWLRQQQWQSSVCWLLDN